MFAQNLSEVRLHHHKSSMARGQCFLATAENRNFAQCLFDSGKKDLTGQSESHEVHGDGEELRSFGI
jgi:hypothetical protein